jgi:hypothetical protein
MDSAADISRSTNNFTKNDAAAPIGKRQASITLLINFYNVLRTKKGL